MLNGKMVSQTENVSQPTVASVVANSQATNSNNVKHGNISTPDNVPKSQTQTAPGMSPFFQRNENEILHFPDNKWFTEDGSHAIDVSLGHICSFLLLIFL